MKLLRELQVAIMMLTRLPAGHLTDAPGIGASSWAFPVVGGIVGAISAITLLCGVWFDVAAPMTAGLALFTMVLVTGGLHEDGLADVADGFGGGGNTARKLEIMRDSQIGSYGALALVLSLGLRWQGLVAIMTLTGPWGAAAALIAVSVTSRSGIAATLWLMPAVRTDGMGKLAEGAVAPQALVAAGIGILAMTATFGVLGLVVVGVMGIAQFGFNILAKRQIGGQTGDVLGAMQQLTEIAGWITLTALL